MSDTDGKKPLGLGGVPRSGQVKQSFSHGRTKSVVVETKRKRVVVPPPPSQARPARAQSVSPAGLGDPSKRPQAFPTPRWNVGWRPCAPPRRVRPKMPIRRAEEDKAREEDRARRREEIEAKDREDRERNESLRLKAEEEERAAKAEAAAKIAAAEARKADVLGTRARSTTPPRPPLPNRQTARHRPPPPRPRMPAGPASAKPGLSPRKTDREKDDRVRPGAKRAGGDDRPPRRQADPERRTCR
jgi:translation initiation factor IF-2